jgi:hypothetical protein
VDDNNLVHAFTGAPMSHAFSHGGFTHAGGETPNQLLTFQLGSPSEADPFFSWEVHQKADPLSERRAPGLAA